MDRPRTVECFFSCMVGEIKFLGILRTERGCLCQSTVQGQCARGWRRLPASLVHTMTVGQMQRNGVHAQHSGMRRHLGSWVQQQRNHFTRWGDPELG